MLQELLAAFCLLDEKAAIHIPKGQPWWMVGQVDCPDFKFLHEQVAIMGLMGDPMGVQHACWTPIGLGTWKRK